MKYQNADKILPKKLLEQVRKYYPEGMLYIPKGEDNLSSYRVELAKRNQKILALFKSRVSVMKLADEFSLSIDSVKKIVYSKASTKVLDYATTLESALSFDKKGLLEEWLYTHFLLFEQNEELANKVINNDYLIFGVVKVPLRLITKVAEDEKKSKAPLILDFVNQELVCVSGSSVLNKLRNQKVNTYYAIIIVNKEGDQGYFMHNYGKHFVSTSSL